MRPVRVWSYLTPLLAAILLAGSHAPAFSAYSDVAASLGLSTTTYPPLHGSGVSLVDFDDDGDVDIFIANGDGYPSDLYRNEGNMQFASVGALMGLNFMGPTAAGVFGDYDGDRDLDLYLCNHGPDDILYRNDGAGFVDVTQQAGVPGPKLTSSAAWGDYDADGDLDLMVVARSPDESDRLYRNDGSGTFTNVSPASWLSDWRLSFQPVFTDFDRDGDLDIFVAVDRGDLNYLFRNDDGAFVDIAASANVEGPFDAMGVAIGDWNLSGYLDLYVTNTPPGNRFFVNQENGTFQDEAGFYGMEVLRTGWGTMFLDYDLDGDEDLYVVNARGVVDFDDTNRLFRNDGVGMPAVDVAVSEGVEDDHPGYGGSCADLNGDGYPEIAIADRDLPFVLYQSAGGNGKWLHVRLQGTQSNTRGIGSWVEITLGATTQNREIHAGSSYRSQLPAIAAFGLGASATVDTVRVTWPSGIVDQVTAVASNQMLTVVEGSFAVAAPPVRAPGLVFESAYPNPSNPAVTLALSLDGPQDVRVDIYDVAGRLVRSFAPRRADGDLRLVWDGKDGDGRRLPSGVYLAKATSARETATRRITLLQ